MEAKGGKQDPELRYHFQQIAQGTTRVASNLSIEAATDVCCADQPNSGRDRRNRKRKDDANDPIPRRIGDHETGDDWVHAASSCCRGFGFQTRRRRIRMRSGRAGWVFDPIRRRDIVRYHHQVHDGWNAHERIPGGQRSEAILGADARRGPRADHPHRCPLWPVEGFVSPEARSKNHRDLCDARCREILHVLFFLSDLHDPRKNLSRRNLVHQRARERLPGRGIDHGDADPSVGTGGRHSGVFDGTGRNRHLLRDPLHPNAGPGRPGTRAHYSAGLFRVALRDAVAYFRTGSPGLPQVRRGDQHCRGIADHRRNLLRRRSRVFQAKGLQSETGNGFVGGHAHQPGLREAESRACRKNGTGEVLSVVYRARVQDGDAADQHSRNPAHQSRERCAAAESHGDQRFARIRLYGSAAGGDPRGRTRNTLRARCPGRRRPAVEAGTKDGGISARAEPVQDADSLGGSQLFGGDPDHYGHAERRESLL
mmetsp:Transcript_1352/g.3459  ORF Transcript_1352/g.3459 Transcript_1352/m.3459 type:complete len:482 (+) Transcript_1352:1637-3082(+)